MNKITDPTPNYARNAYGNKFLTLIQPSNVSDDSATHRMINTKNANVVNVLLIYFDKATKILFANANPIQIRIRRIPNSFRLSIARLLYGNNDNL